MGATPGANKARKAKLAKARDITCGYCPYHKGENAKRRPRSDTHKNHRRKTSR